MRKLGAWLTVTLSALAFWPAGLHAQESSKAGGSGAEPPAVESAADNAEQPSEFPYEVKFEGAKELTLELVMQASETLRLVDSPPASFSRLRRRAQDDVPRILRVMRARGHYAAKVSADIDRTTDPLTIAFKIDGGKSYDIGKVTVELNPPTEDDLDLPSPKRVGLESGKRASSDKIVEAEAALLRRLKNQGFAKARLGERYIVVDHEKATMDITLRLDPGRKVYFGETVITGNSEVETRYIRRLLAWKEGELITPERLDETQLALIESGLFNSVRVDTDAQADEQGRVPIRIELSESKHRSIEVGVRYRTDEGVGGSLGWEHRNLLGTGERLGVELDGSKLGWSLSGKAREPDFLHRRQALVIGTEIQVEKTDAFDSQSIGASVGIERKIFDNVNIAGGVAFTASKVEQDNETDEFGLLSLPTSLNWDHSNDLLDPSDGGRLFISNEPFVDVFGNDIAFNKSSVAYSRYLRLKRERPRLILAGRAKVGFIFGAVRDNIPADERFYAGGGGSVRGYGFQLAGELDDNNDPTGGRSLLELSGELRTQITDSIGAAIFVDSGAAFGSTVPDFEESLHTGVGGGLRYFSPIGPIRLDVGFPLDRRDNDDAFQIYVSIGQAF